MFSRVLSGVVTCLMVLGGFSAEALAVLSLENPLSKIQGAGRVVITIQKDIRIPAESMIVGLQKGEFLSPLKYYVQRKTLGRTDFVDFKKSHWIKVKPSDGVRKGVWHIGLLGTEHACFIYTKTREKFDRVLRKGQTYEIKKVLTYMGDDKAHTRYKLKFSSKSDLRQLKCYRPKEGRWEMTIGSLRAVFGSMISIQEEGATLNESTPLLQGTRDEDSQ